MSSAKRVLRKTVLGLWATAGLAMGIAFGAGSAEAATATINVTSFGGNADVAAALDAQSVFHGTGPKFTEDFDGFATGGSGAALNSAIGTFMPLGPVGTGTTNIGPSAEAQIRDGSGLTGSRYNTTPGGSNYLDSNDNGGIRLEIPDASGVGSFNKLSLLLTDIDDVGDAGFSIGVLGDNVSFAEILAGSLGKFSNGSLHLITFLFSDPTSSVGIDFMIDPGDGFGVDGFVVSSAPLPASVPLPAAGWLLLSALAGLGFLGRRRTAVA